MTKLNSSNTASLALRRGRELIEHSEPFDVFDVTIFMPCFNEAATVALALAEIVETMKNFDISYEIIVTDDNSFDGSVAVIERFMAAHPAVPIRLKRNQRRMGVSYNWSDAALLGRGRYFRMIGAHFQDRRESIAAAFRHLGTADLIATYIEPDLRSIDRVFYSKLYVWLVNLFSGYDLKGYHGTPLHRRVDVLRWHSYRYVGFYADLTTKILDEGITFKEVPVPCIPRIAGRSQAVGLRNAISLMVGLADMLLRRFSRDRLRSVRLPTEAEPRGEHSSLSNASPASTQKRSAEVSRIVQ
jgi:glycosyltransferase involved in cell wall biosynthesis